MNNKGLAVIFVTETKDGFPSDDFYIKRFVEFLFRDLLKTNELVYRFAHMDGITNYKSDNVNNQIEALRSGLSYSNEVFVVYVVDRDSKTIRQAKLLEQIKTYVSSRGHHYRLIINAKDIEEVFGQKVLRSKYLTAKNYKQESDSTYKDKKFHSQCRWVLTSQKPKSNIGRVLAKIKSDSVNSKKAKH